MPSTGKSMAQNVIAAINYRSTVLQSQLQQLM